MPRVKRGTIANKRRKKILKYAKGYKWGRKNKYRQAKEALMHAWSYSYRDRRTKKRDKRMLWQSQINAVVINQPPEYLNTPGAFSFSSHLCRVFLIMPRLRTSYLVALALAFFLLIFLVIPVGKVIYVAFQDSSTGALTLVNFVDFFKTSLFRESFFNSLYVAGMSVLFASIIAMPLAYFTTRFNFGGSILIQTLGIVPLIMPPFVGAVAMQLLFGSNGSVNLLLDQWFGINIPFMEGLNGVILVESIHYFPFILINLSAALNNIDRSMEESAQNLGSYGMRLFRRIVLPLAMPGYLAGASLVFLKAFDDLGTPLLLNVNNMLATQAYLRISSIGISDPMGYVISVILVIFSLFSLWVSMLASRGKDYSGGGKGSSGLLKRDMKGWEKVGAYCLIIFLLLQRTFKYKTKSISFSGIIQSLLKKLF